VDVQSAARPAAAAPPLELRLDGPAGAATTVVLCHGAGAPMDSPFLNVVTAGLAEAGLRVARFELPYMRKRRARTGGRGAPDPPAVLEASWREAIATVAARETDDDPSRIVIGGKSLGGRIASHVADAAHVRGLVCLGYPFHPPDKPEKLRTAHLALLATPTLVVQGSHDPFGTREDVAGYALSPAIRLHWIEGGDHSYRPLRKAIGRGAKVGNEKENVAAAIAAVKAFVLAL
jgi:predicted alpha/beta-hydrolase family hydrolase